MGSSPIATASTVVAIFPVGQIMCYACINGVIGCMEKVEIKHAYIINPAPRLGDSLGTNLKHQVITWCFKFGSPTGN